MCVQREAALLRIGLTAQDSAVTAVARTVVLTVMNATDLEKQTTPRGKPSQGRCKEDTSVCIYQASVDVYSIYNSTLIAASSDSTSINDTSINDRGVQSTSHRSGFSWFGSDIR
mmetsp:Transcript_23024/g.32484  ORF Transcript_23024/g.32484 Transcript_23024/m.32484 type:complete len:114 (-) Transcript_23024:1279-1620(-)